ncbi:RnlA-like RNase toxin of RnlAB toxin-antitoxin system [Pseudomonas lurida]|uniref:type II toxin-antitoxin system RnlA family toxin n=1 Tax=Pseudomonas lurida TaxID=244566 RepID=UPI000C00D3CC|nr:type II toxin-antitoxin system RnlA family toxin [Pseudomonas lurida]PFG22966.1 RnlA-like RNase toxin of RnlAB toxin-antitoxin system [Pseudomonas lurida]
MTERDYKNINLKRCIIEETTHRFLGENGLKLRAYGDKPGTSGLRVVVGSTGIEDATLDIFFTNKGASTLQYKVGKNQELGQKLADALYETIHPDEFVTINLAIKGIDLSDAEALIKELTESAEADIGIDSYTGLDRRHIWKLKSKKHSDELTVTQYETTNKLQIQGRPLSCYQQLSYLLTEILEINALESILFKKDENRSEFVCAEVAESVLKASFGTCFASLPITTRKLLLASLCVRLASPTLPDYCMLVYPELRSLEGAIKQRLSEKNLSHQEDSFGGFFAKTGNQFNLKQEYHGHVDDAKLTGDFGNAYTFFNKQRHGLFHMEEMASASRVISNITHAVALCDEAYVHIKNLYS